MAIPILRWLDHLFLLTFLILRPSQALSPPNPPALTLATPTNITDANVRVPGGSPFVYVGYPSSNLFRFSSLVMSPNPCTLRNECALSARGTFKKDLPSLRLHVNITTQLDGQAIPIFVIEDDFCTWVDVKQNSCPPKNGVAVLNYQALLMQGWIPEAKYGVDIKATSKDAVVFHIHADLQLRDPIGTSS